MTREQINRIGRRIMYPQDAMAPQTVGELGPRAPVSYKEEVTLRMKQAQKEVARCSEMLKLLDENPEIARFMELSRGGF